MALAAEDRTAIAELLALHGHLFDEGELHRLDELFTADVVYDVSDFGQPPLKGVRAISEAAFALGEAIPVGHHVTNIVLTELPDGGGVHARSKGIGVNADGTCGTVTYEDTVVRAADGWRISHRRVLARRAPLGGR
ncbi:nuclear transport factor 2 family protein [Streptomyces sp. NPDC050315]|uniref:nuclear transport factor 2 family protein n=1 Tax=Streptomyces sp. NPDC050315 TaxID=3155039 RepID=UPI003416C77B